MKKNNLQKFHKIIEQMNQEDSVVPEHSEHELAHLPPENVVALLSRATSVSLTSEEKALGSSAFKAFMQANPAGSGATMHVDTSADIAENTLENELASPANNLNLTKKSLQVFYTGWEIIALQARRQSSRVLVFVQQNHKAYIAGVLALVLFFSGSVAYASQDSLPGDILYPVKIHVNEKIETTLATKTEDKARVAVKHAINRVKEAEVLASRGKIDANNQAEIDAAIEQDSSKAVARLAELSGEGNTSADLAIQISSDFEDSLSIHVKNIQNITAKETAKIAMLENTVVTGVSAEDTHTQSARTTRVQSDKIVRDESEESTVKSIEIKIQNRLKNLAEQRAALESKLSASSTIVVAKNSAQNAQGSSRQKLDNLEKYIKSPDDSYILEATEVKEIKDKVEVAKNTFQEATQKMNVGAYANALTLFKHAKDDTEEAEKKLINSYRPRTPLNSTPESTSGRTYIGSSKKKDGTTTMLINVPSLTIVDIDAFATSSNATSTGTGASSSSSVNINVNSGSNSGATATIPASSGVPPASSISTPTVTIPSVNTPSSVSVPGL